ncbi:MAG: hypothetical protein JO168_13805 [Solirubrobacterales bacterium]|nr:hypothetical protein [Solirubrobacterales bacterium]
MTAIPRGHGIVEAFGNGGISGETRSSSTVSASNVVRCGSHDLESFAPGPDGMSTRWQQKWHCAVVGPSGRRRRVPRTMAPSAPVKVRNAELATVREAMRELPRLLAELDAGAIEKLVLTQRNQMRAVLVSVERYSQLEQAST